MSVNSTKNCFLWGTLALELSLIFLNRSSWVANGIALNEVNIVTAVKMASIYPTPQYSVKSQLINIMDSLP